MDRNKAKGYLGIANKAGYLIIGGDNLQSYKQKLFLVLVDVDAQKNTKKIAQKLTEKAEVLWIDGLGQLLSIPTCKIVGIKNKGLSENIKLNLTD